MKRFSTTAESEPGRGILVCHCFNQQSKFERIHTQYPLKFVPTNGHANRLAVVYMLSYGGGVISGDIFNIDITVKKDAILLLMTQGNTKIFKDRVHQRLWLASLDATTQPTFQFESSDTIAPSIQQIQSIVEPDATLLVLPDPVTCFRDSSFQSKQLFQLHNTSQLVLLDWFTSGRLTRGENWSFKHYSSRIDIKIDQRWAIKDAMVLDDEHYMKPKAKDETAYASRLRPYTCFATLIIIANQDSALYQSVTQLIQMNHDKRIMPLTLKKQTDILWSVSPIVKGKGVLVRVAGMTTEQVRDFVKYDCLSHGLTQVVGEGMFNKILM